ncbi:MAG: hypothetical protein Pg6C_15150 [Treponemataceae bacterium]|nr:MAG: hypothetical protein Pg6C_15150 [Treponemataceae bacterium]
MIDSAIMIHKDQCVPEDTGASLLSDKCGVIFNELMEKISPQITRRIARKRRAEIKQAGLVVPAALNADS